jgi:DNA processing protein
MTPPLPDDLRDLLALQLVPGLGPRRTAALLAHFGTASRASRASAAELQAVPSIGAKLADDIAQHLADADVDGEVARMQKAGASLLVLGRPGFPAGVASINDPPHLLYLRGTLTDADASAVAVVGSRHCTGYGKRMTMKIAGDLARAGVTVVSGLARGIDGAAHQGALEAGGRTLAVLAGGLNRLYPPEHAGLADAVVNAGGLLTEASMDQEPMAPLFPARNRIISALSKVVVIVEAPEKSGALITASHAAEQGRTVLAVPGPADAATSGGCHALIRDGAVLCRGADDVLEELHGVSAMARAAKAAPSGQPAPAGPPPGLDETQRRLWDFLATGARSVDEMAQQLGVAMPQLSTALMMMEMKKAVRRLPGNRYERC